jgi:hypothetical protein
MITPAQYLQASGTTAICLIQGDDTGCCFKVSRKVDASGVVATFWIDKPLAVCVARIARNKAGKKPSLECATLALHKAAAARGALVTPGHIAIARATELSAKLEAALDHMLRTGRLAEFNREYSRRRKAAKHRGEGYMSFTTAKTRLHRAIIARLVNKQGANSSAIFHAVFDG